MHVANVNLTTLQVDGVLTMSHFKLTVSLECDVVSCLQHHVLSLQRNVF